MIIIAPGIELIVAFDIWTMPLIGVVRVACLNHFCPIGQALNSFPGRRVAPEIVAEAFQAGGQQAQLFDGRLLTRHTALVLLLFAVPLIEAQGQHRDYGQTDRPGNQQTFASPFLCPPGFPHLG